MGKRDDGSVITLYIGSWAWEEKMGRKATEAEIKAAREQTNKHKRK